MCALHTQNSSHEPLICLNHIPQNDYRHSPRTMSFNNTTHEMQQQQQLAKEEAVPGQIPAAFPLQNQPNSLFTTPSIQRPQSLNQNAASTIAVVSTSNSTSLDSAISDGYNNKAVTPVDNKVKKRSRRRKNTHIACINCSKWHLSCDDSRPCKRCIVKNIQDTCVDAPRKRAKYLEGISDDLLKTEGQQIATSPNNTNREIPKPLMAIARIAASSSMSPMPTTSPPQYVTSPNNPLAKANSQSPTNGVSSPQLYNPNSPPYYKLYRTDTPSSRANAPTFAYPSQLNNVYKYLLGPNSEEIINIGTNLFMDHHPLVPVNVPSNSLDFKRLNHDPSATSENMNTQSTTQEVRYDVATKQYYLSTASKSYPEILPLIQATHPTDIPKDTPITELIDNPTLRTSIVLATHFPNNKHGVSVTKCNNNWEHALRYDKPMEIYSLIDQPFSHTRGFHYLFLYIKKRFPKEDVVEMCRSMAEFRPIFLNCAITLTEEDMIFVEQSYQRTLLEYSRHISKVGVPTCIWRRNGQVSYMNEEFELLTGWTMAELLNKMTFIVEIMDDDSVREYFKTFATIAYKDFKGSQQMKVCRLLTPIQGTLVECECIWTLKRDFAGLPLMIIANFMPTFQLT